MWGRRRNDTFLIRLNIFGRDYGVNQVTGGTLTALHEGTGLRLIMDFSQDPFDLIKEGQPYPVNVRITQDG